MARPKKHNVEYFSHDVQMRNDVKIKALRRKYSHLGYSIWNIILELLGDAEYFEIEWSDLSIELLTPEFDCDSEELKDVINYCIKLDLLQLTNGYIHSDKFTKRLEDTVLTRRTGYCSINAKRNNLKGVNDYNNSIEYELNVVNDNINRQSKVKESKVNESIVKDSIVEKSIVTVATDFFTTDYKTKIEEENEFKNIQLGEKYRKEKLINSIPKTAIEAEIGFNNIFGNM